MAAAWKAWAATKVLADGHHQRNALKVAMLEESIARPEKSGLAFLLATVVKPNLLLPMLQLLCSYERTTGYS
jgi:uncharacterized protein (DUF1015 family)